LRLSGLNGKLAFVQQHDGGEDITGDFIRLRFVSLECGPG